VSCEAAFGRIWNDRAYSPRAPLRLLSTAARASETTASFRLSHPPPASPCGAPRANEKDASDRLLLPITLSTSTRAPSVPRACAPGSLDVSRHPARFGGPCVLFRCRAFSSPRRDARPYLWSPLCRPPAVPRGRALFLRRFHRVPEGPKTDSSGIPVTGPRHPRVQGAFHRQEPRPTSRMP